MPPCSHKGINILDLASEHVYRSQLRLRISDVLPYLQQKRSPETHKLSGVWLLTAVRVELKDILHYRLEGSYNFVSPNQAKLKGRLRLFSLKLKEEWLSV